MYAGVHTTSQLGMIPAVCYHGHPDDMGRAMAGGVAEDSVSLKAWMFWLANAGNM